MYKTLILILSTTLCLAANAAETAESIIDTCWTDNDHKGMTSCVIAFSKKARQDLESVEKEMLDAIRKSPEQNSYKTFVNTQFKKSVQTYRIYRKEHCSLRTALASMGNGPEDNRRACEAELDIDRTQQIAADMFWLK